MNIRKVFTHLWSYVAPRWKTEGEMLPPFYYGSGYRDWCRNRTRFYVMPFNHIVSAAVCVWRNWNIYRKGATWADEQVIAFARIMGWDALDEAHERDGWLLLCRNGDRLYKITSRMDWQCYLNGGSYSEIWCIGTVPPEVLELCSFKTIPQNGRVRVLLVRD